MIFADSGGRFGGRKCRSVGGSKVRAATAATAAAATEKQESSDASDARFSIPVPLSTNSTRVRVLHDIHDMYSRVGLLVNKATRSEIRTIWTECNHRRQLTENHN